MCSLSLSNEEKAKSLNERLVRHSDGDGVSGAIAPYLFLFILFVLTYWIIKFFPVRGPEFGA